ncbi:NAD(P)H-binding protein [Streptomyces sp. NPDC046862]|uniref:NmrA family NAD(P)-binding protein n=1 Tax=Streptomyces sp. NPDC046862 TaxID=3154603 RepID=UPI003453A6CA
MSVHFTPRPAVLVIGGTGKTGRRVAERLASLGHSVRIGSRSSEPSFVWEDTGSWKAALDGVDAVYLTHPDITVPGSGEQIAAFSRAAVDSGVRRLVLLSARGDATLHTIEEGVRNSGADWTVVRPGWFNQNFSEGFFLDAVLAGEIVLPVGDVAEAFVDIDDIADVVVAALTDDRHIGKTYELSGPRLLTFADVAEELSRATGREITYIPLTPEQFRASLRENGLPEDLADGYAQNLDGRNAYLVHGVEEALGRTPRDFSDYAREATATGVWNP